MKIASAHPAGQMRQLAPFILLSLLLHAVLLFVIHPPARNLSVARSHPMEVYLSAAVVSEQAPVPLKARTGKHRNPARLPLSANTQAAPLATPPDATASSGTAEVFNPQQLMDSAKSIAREEARKTEQQIAALEKKKLNTPIGSLEQYLKQPHQEIHLANGMLKIITAAGAVCFQAAPYFARDSAAVFGIPASCP